ncbi:MAG: hypothetical protein QOG71_2932 [Pyrinomonadaceae bacterium]|nr:hypothetical protein [Pyrinomonadaceae bacterium]
MNLPNQAISHFNLPSIQPYNMSYISNRFCQAGSFLRINSTMTNEHVSHDVLLK